MAQILDGECEHGVLFTVTCHDCGRWRNQGQPWVPPPPKPEPEPEVPLAEPCPKCGQYGDHVCLQSDPLRIDAGPLLGYLDLVAEAIIGTLPNGEANRLMTKLTNLRGAQIGQPDSTPTAGRR